MRAGLGTLSSDTVYTQLPTMLSTSSIAFTGIKLINCGILFSGITLGVLSSFFAHLPMVITSTGLSLLSTLPSVIPTFNSSIAASSNDIIIIAVPICGGVALLLVLFLLMMGVCVVKCRRKNGTLSERSPSVSGSPLQPTTLKYPNRREKTVL